MAVNYILFSQPLMEFAMNQAKKPAEKEEKKMPMKPGKKK
jgi:hypothetical protein